jgi:hypothetical protein
MKDKLFEITGRSRVLIAVFSVILLGVMLKIFGAVPPPSRAPKLAFDYVMTNVTGDLWFNVYRSVDVSAPLNTWTLVSNFSANGGTNMLGITNGIGTWATAPLTPIAGQQFFYAVGSNTTWGEGSPSPVVAAQAPPVGLLPRIIP